MLSKIREVSFEERRYQSFEEYVKIRIDNPIDLIVGRGNINDSSYPRLVDSRYVLSTETMMSYQPYTVDIDKNSLPDLVASITNIQEMKYFPDNSVDDIYLERIFPPLYKNLNVYIVAIRILKLGGTLVIDFNDGVKSNDQRKKQIQSLEDAMNFLNIPFNISLLKGKLPKRNDLEDLDKIYCFKADNIDPLKLSALTNGEKGRKLLFRANSFLV